MSEIPWDVIEPARVLSIEDPDRVIPHWTRAYRYKYQDERAVEQETRVHYVDLGGES